MQQLNLKTLQLEYDNLEHLSSCLGDVVDSSIGALSNLPSDAKKMVN
jgi:hypothetical protein